MVSPKKKNPSRPNTNNAIVKQDEEFLKQAMADPENQDLFVPDSTPSLKQFVSGEKKTDRLPPKSEVNPDNRDPEQRERDLIDIARLFLHAYTQEQIARAISADRPYTLTSMTISKDLKLIHQRWRESYLTDYDTAKTRELVHLDELERAYWKAWERSLESKEEIRTMTIQDENAGTHTYRRNKVEQRKVNRDGQAAFLQGIERCIQQRCRILGIESPKTININWREEAKKNGIDPDEAIDMLVGSFVDQHEDQDYDNDDNAHVQPPG